MKVLAVYFFGLVCVWSIATMGYKLGQNSYKPKDVILGNVEIVDIIIEGNKSTYYILDEHKNLIKFTTWTQKQKQN
jgi:hypothetical protein